MTSDEVAPVDAVGRSLRLAEVSPYFGSWSKETYRRFLALVLVGFLTLTIALTFALAAVERVDGNTVIPAVLAGAFGLVGSAAGFYFGHAEREEADAAAHPEAGASAAPFSLYDPLIADEPQT